MAYPLVSSVINNIDYMNKADDYAQTVEHIPDETILKMFEDAENYNLSLNNNAVITDPFDLETYEKLSGVYKEVMDVDGKGLIGYIEIPCIKVKLPIYHGTTEEVLSDGAGHLQNTSMPIGGKSTHAVISAHSAYPGKTFFDYLTDMKEGDCFYVTVLNRKLKYEVDQIKTVLPSDTSDFAIIPDEDLVTLVTCTPYSINTHRLLVRGVNVPYEEDKEETSNGIIRVESNYLILLGFKIPYWVMAIIIAVFVLLVVLLVVAAIRLYRRSVQRKKAKHMENNKKQEAKEGG